MNICSFSWMESWLIKDWWWLQPVYSWTNDQISVDHEPMTVNRGIIIGYIPPIINHSIDQYKPTCSTRSTGWNQHCSNILSQASCGLAGRLESLPNCCGDWTASLQFRWHGGLSPFMVTYHHYLWSYLEITSRSWFINCWMLHERVYSGPASRPSRCIPCSQIVVFLGILATSRICWTAMPGVDLQDAAILVGKMGT